MALGPAASAVVVFNRDEHGDYLLPVPLDGGQQTVKSDKPWEVELQHYEGHTEKIEMEVLSDLKENPKYAHFAGTIKYKNTFFVKDPEKIRFLNLGKVYGISTVLINGRDAGVKWFGHRIYAVGNMIKKGRNTIEITVVTVMVNYVKTLTDNEVAQYWTNEKEKDQPLQSLGLVGPVGMY